MSAPQGPDRPAAPPFASAALARQLAVDQVVRGLMVAGLIVLLALGSLLEAQAPNFAMVLLLAVAASWIGVGTISSRVWRQIPRITALLEQDPSAAESAIAAALRRRPLQRSVRLLLYHRLALLRHRQQRFGETAAICQAVLAQKLGPAAAVRGNLLLMLAESRLECGDLAGAHLALVELQRSRLLLVESLQRLSLQIRYEITCGYDLHALQDLERKLDLIELMPAAQGAAMHVLLARAAARAGQAALAQWLGQRAELLGGKVGG